MMRDRTWCDLPLGLEAVEYMRQKSNRLTPSSYTMYESTLAALAHFYPDTTLAELEPPVGTRLLEDFLDAHWGELNPKTYNKNLTVLRDFSKRAVLRGKLHGDPTLPIERGKPRQYHRSTFTSEQVDAILEANADEPRYQVALLLLLDYGIRKGALANVRFEHFDHASKRLVLFTKGGKIHHVPIPQQNAWDEIARIEPAQPWHYLLCKQRVHAPSLTIRRQVAALALDVERLILTAQALDGTGARLVGTQLTHARELLHRPGLIGETLVSRDPDKPMGAHGIHDWWYRCLARAGVVPEGVTRGTRLHQARHGAGQRVLDKTGNLKAVKELLGHASIATTGDTYTGWDIDQLAQTLLDVIPDRAIAGATR